MTGRPWSVKWGSTRGKPHSKYVVVILFYYYFYCCT